MASDADVLIIGGGVVGLACAVEIARRGSFVTLLERHARLATEGSSRNSGVIHSGLYYPSGSNKARFCVRGRHLLEARCRRFGIPHRVLGKVIVASSDDELRTLEALARRAVENDAGPTRLLSRDELRAYEPAIEGRAALHVEATAVLRTTEYVASLKREAEALGAELHVGAEVAGIERTSDGRFTIAVHEARFTATHVVDCAGLSADVIARMAGIDVDAHGLVQRFARGSWVALDERYRKAIGGLVYPVPHVETGASSDGAPTALGIHLTRDLDGFLFAGPDLEWLEDSRVRDEHGRVRPTAFELPFDLPARLHAAVARWLPAVREDELFPLATGLRSKLHGPGEPAADFVVRDGAELGAPGFWLLAGIESPGLTASLALAEWVGAAIEEAQRS